MSAQPPEPAGSPLLAGTPTRRLRLRLGLVITLFAACGIGVLIWRASRPDATRTDALQAANQGRFTEAEPVLKAISARNPDDVLVVEALARGYSAADNSREAESYLTRWVELRPHDPNALRARYEFYRKIKVPEKAYADGRRLLELESGDAPRPESVVQLRRSLVGQAFSLGAFEDAERLCQEALRDTPGDRSLRSMSSEIRRARGDPVGAATILDQLLKDAPTHTPAMLSRGILYLENGEPERAIPLLREVLRTDRTRQRTAGTQLVVALERTGQVEEANRVAADVRRLQDVEVYGEAMKSQPDNLDIRVRLAERLLADGHTHEGVANLEAVLMADPRHRAAHLALAAHYEKQGQPQRAAEHRKLAATP